MLKEAIDKLVELAHDAAAPQVVRLPGDPAHVLHIAMPDGTLERVQTTPGDRAVYLHRLSDLAALAQNHFDAEVASVDCMAVFVHHGYVQLIFDHRNGRERGHLPLSKTEEYQFFDRTLGPHDDAALFEAKHLRRHLLTTLINTGPSSKLIHSISGLNVTRSELGHAHAGRGRESMGKAVNQQVDDDVAMPNETQTFSVRMFANPDLDIRFPLTCRLDPDPATHRWFLRPLESSWLALEAATITHIVEVLRNRLAKTKVPVYEGRFDQSHARYLSIDNHAHHGKLAE